MPRAADRAGAGRGLFARLLRVMLVIAAFGVLLAPLCADGMIAGSMRMASPDSAVGTPVVAHEASSMSGMSGEACIAAGGFALGQCAPGEPSALDIAVSSPALPAPPGNGLLAACIAFLVAVLVAMLGLPRLRPAGATAVEPGGRPSGVPYPVRRLTLAELCVLRT